MLRRLFAFALLLAACSSDGGSASSSSSGSSGTPSDACPTPGFRAASGECANGPWATCPEGSKARESGWGCEAILPESACTGATRDVLGQTECVPIGDCNAAFPPPGATIFVDAKGTADGATHFTSIVAAVAAAPAGATIAVAPGTYTGGMQTSKDVTIVGKCPAQVTMKGPGVDAFRVLGTKLTLRGLTITGFRLAIVPAANSVVEITDSVLDGNRDDTLDLDDGGSTFTARRIAVRNTAPSPDGVYGYGMNAQLSANVDIADSVFVGNHSGHIRLSTNAKGLFDHVVFRDAQPAPQHDTGYALVVQNDASATITNSAVVAAYAVALVAGDGGSMRIDGVLVGATKPALKDTLGRALNVFGGSQVTAKRFFTYDNHDVSIMVDGAGTHLALDASAIVDTTTFGTNISGRGMSLQGSSADVTDTAFVGANEAGIVSVGKGTKLTLARSFVGRAAPDGNGDFGDGILVGDEGGIDVTDSEIAEHVRAGLAIGEGATARVARSRIRSNAIGLYAEDGMTVVEGDSPPSPSQIAVTPDTLFLANGQRVGAGVLPLPQPLPAGN
jgi:hypothetical protein